MRRHRLAALTILAAYTLDVVCGLAFSAVEHVSIGLGLYWALATATTVGYGDVTPKTDAGHILAVAVMLTVIPLFSATFSLFTAGVTKEHIDRRHKEIKDALDSSCDGD